MENQKRDLFLAQVLDTTTRYILAKGYHNKRQKAEESPVYCSRIVYSDDSKAQFPFSEWPGIHQNRLLDIQEKNSMIHEKHIAWSREGIRMFFVLHYEATAIEEVVEHALMSQDVLKDFYKGNLNGNFTFWLLGRSKGKLPFEGYHIVYPYIVVDTARGRQLTLSLRDRINRTFGLSTIVQESFQEHLAALIPIFSPDQISCSFCEDQKNCDRCYGTGVLTSTDFYTPIALIGEKGESIEITERLAKDMGAVVAETSIVPTSDLGFYTPGYQLPSNEPELIPVEVQSKHVEDVKDFSMFKKDRQSINRRLSSYQRETNPEVVRQCQLEIRKYHTAYSQAVVSRVDRTNSVVTVNLSSGGRSFCRICNNEGLEHKSNRIYFLFDAKNLSVIQLCYDSLCSTQAKKSEVRKRLTQSVFYKAATAKLLFTGLNEHTW